MPVVPPAPRFKVETLDSNATLITIPSRKNWFITIFFGLWLIPWTYFGIISLGILLVYAFAFVGNAIAGGPSPSAVGTFGLGGFLFIWLGMWALGEGMVLYTVLWRIVGKEVIDVSSSGITIANKIFSFSRPKEYSSHFIKDLRISQPVVSFWSPWSRMNTFWGRGEGVIAFDYGAKTYRFGSGLDEAEAKMILAEITQRYPQYLSRNS